ncbi:MAG TPA: hypothetical protein PLW81_11795 [Thiobacillaceae bacterium]|nr:hypothetical protein [Thiobacillaceae bacterium]
MNNAKRSPKFWLGNALLAVSLILLFFLGSLWSMLGNWAMGLWMILAGVGMYLVTTDSGASSSMPD